MLAVDIETYNSVNLLATGVYKYAESPDFEILLLAYAMDDDPVNIIDCTKQAVDPELVKLLTDPRLPKTAFNANFERTCLARWLRMPMAAEQWWCTAVHAATLGLPRSLQNVGKEIGLPADEQKMKEGKALISYFSKPCRPTKLNGGRTRNQPQHDPAKWALFKEYCKQDVVTERAIRKKLDRFPVPEDEHKLWVIDQQINDRGILIDRQLVNEAIRADEAITEHLVTEAVLLTGLDNPNSLAQLKSWLQEEADTEIGSLTKKTIPGLISDASSETVKRVLEIRKEMSRTSIKKYQALDRAANDDDRVRGTMLFHGARTARWSGRIFQPQNLPQNHLDDLDTARSMLRAGQIEKYGNVPDTLSQLIRTALIPKPGCKFYVADFSAIEARVIAWLAGEAWRMDVFRTHGKIYEASASQMFRVPIETIAKDRENYPMRQKGKIAELALGYGGATGALEAMGALNMGLTTDELPGLVKAWRKANPKITDLWWSVGAAAIEAVQTRQATETNGITYSKEAGFLFARLPSGRRIAYARPRIEPDRFGRDGLVFEGTEQGKNQWGRIETYGPKLVENLVQAISRDLLANGLKNLTAAGYNVVFHVHDEAVIEADGGNLKEVEQLMADAPAWAEGLPLRADGYVCAFYRKE
jgi:DNA polymerase